MKKSIMDLDRLFKKEHYKNILFLLELFELNRGLKNIGLCPRHFRFALMKNPNLTNEIEKRIKEFFNYENLKIFLLLPNLTSSSLDELYRIGLLKKGSIESPQKLTNYLKKLVNLGYIKQDGKGKFTRYWLSEKYYLEKNKKSTIQKLKMWDYSDMAENWNIENLNFDFGDECCFSGLYGINQNMFNNCSESDKYMIFNCLKNIHENLGKLAEFKGKWIIENKQKREKKDSWIGYHFDWPIFGNNISIEEDILDLRIPYNLKK